MKGDYAYFVTSALFAMELFDAHLSEAGAISGLLVAGCFIGRFFTGYLITRLGTRRALLISLTLLILSVGLIFSAVSLPLFALERLCFGIAIGAVSTVTGTLVAYCIPATTGLWREYFLALHSSGSGLRPLYRPDGGLP